MWENLGRANSGTVNTTLDELTRSAIDGGLGSNRCELIAEALVNMSSVEVKGKLLARLRRVSSHSRVAILSECIALGRHPDQESALSLTSR